MRPFPNLSKNAGCGEEAGFARVVATARLAPPVIVRPSSGGNPRDRDPPPCWSRADDDDRIPRQADPKRGRRHAEDLCPPLAMSGRQGRYPDRPPRYLGQGGRATQARPGPRPIPQAGLDLGALSGAPAAIRAARATTTTAAPASHWGPRPRGCRRSPGTGRGAGRRRPGRRCRAAAGAGEVGAAAAAQEGVQGIAAAGPRAGARPRRASSTSRSQPAGGGVLGDGLDPRGLLLTAGRASVPSRVAATTTRTGSSPSGPTGAVAASRSNTGPCSAIRRYTATPSRRTSPSWFVGGPSTIASIPNGRNARHSARPSTPVGSGPALRHPRPPGAGPEPPGPRFWSQTIQAVEGEPGARGADGLAGLQHGPGQPAGGDDGGGAASSATMRRTIPSTCPAKPQMALAWALHGVLADHRAGRRSSSTRRNWAVRSTRAFMEIWMGGDGRAPGVSSPCSETASKWWRCRSRPPPPAHRRRRRRRSR